MMRAGLRAAALMGSVLLLCGAGSGAAADQAGRTAAESPPPHWPDAAEAPKGAPNVLVILTDDVGYTASSTFGGPVPTATFDRLAAAGLRYSAFHTTAMCSPTRAALLTGRNHHRVAMGNVEDFAAGYEGYTGILPANAGTLSDILRRHGYSTAAFGKWHLVPYSEMGPAGPFDRWPTHKGFEKFYGFLAGETDQFAPTLWEGTMPVEPPAGDPTYILDRDLADQAIGWIAQVKATAPAKPFFVYYAPGTAHAPVQAPADWIARFKGRFDQGWDQLREATFRRQKELGVVPATAALTPRPDAIPAWDSLSADQRRVYARMMEAYAAALAYADFQIGRILDSLRQQGELDNTLVVYIQGDNGGSATGGLGGLFNDVTHLNGIKEPFETVLAHLDEIGGPASNGLYPAGWAHATSTPFQWYKQIASHFGGTRNGMVISWPKRISGGGVRSQFHHVVDVLPTVLEAAGVPPPDTIDGVAQMPVDGVSMVYSFAHPQEPSHHKTQYFEMVSNRALYQDGWIASTVPGYAPWEVFKRSAWNLDEQRWELYDLTTDFSQSVNVASRHPERLRQLQDLFWIEAARNNALPILGTTQQLDAARRPDANAGRTRFFYAGPMTRLPGAVAPDFFNKSYQIAAEVELPGEGVLASVGNRFGGFALYVQDGLLRFTYNYAGLELTEVASDRPLPAGRHRLVLRYDHEGGPGAGGTLSLLLDGSRVGGGRLVRTLPKYLSLDANFNVGRATGSPVSRRYAVPFAFTGTLQGVEVTLPK